MYQPSKNAKGTMVMYSIEFHNEDITYNYRDKYYFVEPQITNKCTCHCPQLVGEAECNADSDTCKPNGDSTCTEISFPTSEIDSCFHSIHGSGRVCCAVYGKANPNAMFEGFYISKTTPNILYNVSLTKYSLPSWRIEDKVNKKIAKNGALESSDEVVSLTLAGGKSYENLLPGGWYFGDKGGDNVLTGIKMNSNREFAVDKLGWLKWDEKGYRWDTNLIAKAYSQTVRDCQANIINLKENLKYKDDIRSIAKRVSDKYKEKIKTINRHEKNKTVKITTWNPSVKLHISVKNEHDSALKFLISPSEFKDFTGIVILDSSSNRYLNLTVFKGRGILLGHINHQSFTVTITSLQQTTYNDVIPLTITCPINGMMTVCLKPIYSSNETCRAVNCVEKEMDKILEDTDGEVEVEEGLVDSMWNPRAWKKYTNPAEWFKGKMSSVEAFVMCIVLLISAIATLVAIRILKFFHCTIKITKSICCCFFCGGGSGNSNSSRSNDTSHSNDTSRSNESEEKV